MTGRGTGKRRGRPPKTQTMERPAKFQYHLMKKPKYLLNKGSDSQLSTPTASRASSPASESSRRSISRPGYAVNYLLLLKFLIPILVSIVILVFQHLPINPQMVCPIFTTVFFFFYFKKGHRVDDGEGDVVAAALIPANQRPIRRDVSTHFQFNIIISSVQR